MATETKLVTHFATEMAHASHFAMKSAPFKRTTTLPNALLHLLTVNVFCKCVRVNMELVNVEFWRDFGFSFFFLNLKKEEKIIWNEKECFLRGYFSNNIFCKLED